MAKFSSDVDLLKWEPVLFGELALPSQTLCQGQDGVVSGTTFSSASASLVSAGVEQGHVIYLNDGDGIDGCYEVVSVESSTQLTISVVRQSVDDSAVAPPGGSGIGYRVSTFDPQAEEVSYGLLQYFGIKLSGDECEVTADDILNSRALRQSSVFAVLSAVFVGSACGADDQNGYWKKSLRYKELFHTARIKARLEIDTDDDSVSDRVQTGGTVRLRRG